MGDGPLVHVVDDDEGVLVALCLFLRSAGIASQSYTSAESLLNAAPGLSPGCIVTDMRLRGMNGLELVRHMRVASPAHPVIVISGLADNALVVEILRAGAADFLEKPFTTATFIAVVRRALSRPAADGSEAPGLFAALSPLQRGVIERLLKGLPNVAIAQDLGLSEEAVDGHLAQAMAATKAERITDLIRTAIAAGL